MLGRPFSAFESFRVIEGEARQITHQLGQIPKWPNGGDCKSLGLRLQWFESTSAHSSLPGRVAERSKAAVY